MADQVEAYRALGDSPNKPAPLHTVPVLQRMAILNELMQRYSGDTCHIVTPLPFPCDGSDLQQARTYVTGLDILARGLPPTIMVCNGEDIPFISTCI